MAVHPATRLLPLPRHCYEPSAEQVAQDLLGHYLVRVSPIGLSGGLIVETEAYLRGDPACHAAPGLTQRNKAMFGPPGHAYVYLIYGLHYCVNAVCLPQGQGEAVLIRALEPAFGQEQMLLNRKARDPIQLCSGPAKLCQALGITRAEDGLDLTDSRSPLQLAANPDWRVARARLGKIVVTQRIGITKAAEMPLRFYLMGSRSVSKRDHRAESLLRES